MTRAIATLLFLVVVTKVCTASVSVVINIDNDSSDIAKVAAKKLNSGSWNEEFSDTISPSSSGTGKVS